MYDGSTVQLVGFTRCSLGVNIVIMWYMLTDSYLPQRGPTYTYIKCKVYKTSARQVAIISLMREREPLCRDDY